MNRKFYLLLLTVSFSMPQLKAQQLEWAYSIRSQSPPDFVGNMSSNGSGFALIASVENSVSYDMINASPAFNGPRNVVARYDANGAVLWVLSHPGDGNVYRSNAVLTGPSGEVYVSGRFNGTLDMDPSPNVQDVTAYADDVYLQKFDAAGNLIWVGHTSASGQPSKIAMKSNGNLVVIGRSQTASSALLSSGSTVTIEAGVYLLEFAPNGDAINAYSISTPTGYSDQMALGIDGSDHIYVGASIDGNMDLDMKGGVISVNSNASYDAVLVKYDADFNYQWHKRFGDIPTSGPAGWDGISALAFDESNNVYAAGQFTWTADFDPDDNPGIWVLMADDNTQSPDGFVIKYSPDGVIQWIQDAGGHPSITGNKDVYFQDMVIKNGQIVVSGELSGKADFDGSSNDFILQTMDLGLGLCYAQYTTAGDFVNAWIVDGVGANEDEKGIELLGNGIVICGTFQKKMDADPTASQYVLATDSTGSFYDFDNDIFAAYYTLDGLSELDEFGLITLQVYPNPSENGLFRVSCKDEEYLILDMNGKEILRGKGEIVNLQKYASGAYLMYFPKRSQHVKLLKY